MPELMPDDRERVAGMTLDDLRSAVGRWLRIKAKHDPMFTAEQRGWLGQLSADADHSFLLLRLFDGEEPHPEPLPSGKKQGEGWSPKIRRDTASVSVAGGDVRITEELQQALTHMYLLFSDMEYPDPEDQAEFMAELDLVNAFLEEVAPGVLADLPALPSVGVRVTRERR